jgi:hypothetical protein
MIAPTLIVALAIVCHAWIGRIQGPAAVVNAVAWLVALLTLLALLLGELHR